MVLVFFTSSWPNSCYSTQKQWVQAPFNPLWLLKLWLLKLWLLALVRALGSNSWLFGSSSWLFGSDFFLCCTTFTLSGSSPELQVTPKAPSVALLLLRCLLSFYAASLVSPSQQNPTSNLQQQLSYQQ